MCIRDRVCAHEPSIFRCLSRPRGVSTFTHSVELEIPPVRRFRVSVPVALPLRGGRKWLLSYEKWDALVDFLAQGQQQRPKSGGVSVPVVLPLRGGRKWLYSVSYTHLRAHETVLDLVCRLLLE